MEFDQANRIIRTLYAGINPYEVSHDARDLLPAKDPNLGYGEVMPHALHQILRDMPAREGAVFYDLGSGTGRTLMLAALLFDFPRLVGIEIVEALHQTALAALDRYNHEIRPGLPAAKQQQTIEFRCADLRTEDFSDADVVFVHATCFRPKLMEALARQLERLRPGARVAITSKVITSSRFETTRIETYEMDWGATPVLFLERRA
ncbi:MAG: hypothetical protein AB1714_18050 [Acidobacteriota bacterium]